MLIVDGRRDAAQPHRRLLVVVEGVALMTDTLEFVT